MNSGESDEESGKRHVSYANKKKTNLRLPNLPLNEIAEREDETSSVNSKNKTLGFTRRPKMGSLKPIRDDFRRNSELDGMMQVELKNGEQGNPSDNKSRGNEDEEVIIHGHNDGHGSPAVTNRSRKYSGNQDANSDETQRDEELPLKKRVSRSNKKYLTQVEAKKNEDKVADLALDTGDNEDKEPLNSHIQSNLRDNLENKNTLEDVEDNEERMKIKRDAIIVRQKIRGFTVVHKEEKPEDKVRYHSYKLCICCMKFGQYKNAYMCILVNDIILSANMTLYTFISTFLIWYYIIPLIFFVLASFTYVYWRVESERFSILNTIYLWFRLGVFIIINVPFMTILYRIMAVLATKRKGENVNDLTKNLSSSESLILAIISLNNVYVLIIICGFALVYNIFNLVWCCQMKRILSDGFEQQTKREEILRKNDNKKKEESSEVRRTHSDRDIRVHNEVRQTVVRNPDNASLELAIQNRVSQRNLVKGIMGSVLDAIKEETEPSPFPSSVRGIEKKLSVIHDDAGTYASLKNFHQP